MKPPTSNQMKRIGNLHEAWSIIEMPPTSYQMKRIGNQRWKWCSYWNSPTPDASLT